MTPVAIIVCVFACIGAVGTVFTALGVLLPSTSSFGNFCRKAGADLKALLGYESAAESVANLVK